MKMQPSSSEGRVRLSRGTGGKVSPARRAAFDILRRVEETDAYASVLLATSTDDLRPEDRGLCYELVLGVLRRQLWLDRIIEHYALRSADKLDTPVRLALRLGLYQLRFLARVPASAAVNESVNLAYEAKTGSAAALINAVLRRATREPDYDPSADIVDPVEKLAVETSHPAWMIRRWIKQFGEDEARQLAEANNRTAPVAFRVNTLRANADDVTDRLRAAGDLIEPSSLVPGAWRMISGSSQSLRQLAREGLIYPQDEASQLVAHAVGARPGERVLDLCAAPGSKTTHIAMLAQDQALMVAGDIHKHRLRVVGELAVRQGLASIRLIQFNAAEALPFADGLFDRVLVDAPCTGTGTLRHNPEIRWRIRAENIAQSAAGQQQILRCATRMVRPGGRLVYSTCSVEREENEDVVAALLEDHTAFKQVPVAATSSLPQQTAPVAVRTWPHRDDVSGFFIATFICRN
ncbi:MAG: 16S rRNA (cytosine(967)-C(5))-methyltransferase RsmB [Pyrinomonadaceae bacterium]|nr:16S rRNA (cytosine(967)-C(5))-methyltransferase RsmB [Pyrinomonadaceae bacterium]